MNDTYTIKPLEWKSNNGTFYANVGDLTIKVLPSGDWNISTLIRSYSRSFESNTDQAKAAAESAYQELIKTALQKVEQP